jgi:hypothetical protein
LAAYVGRVKEIVVQVFSAGKSSDIAEIARIPKYMPSRLISDDEVKRQANSHVLIWRFVGLMPLSAQRKNTLGRTI